MDHTVEKTRIFALGYVDEKIGDALKAKRGKAIGSLEIQHYTLIGEFFVDGHMNKGIAMGGDEQ